MLAAVPDLDLIVGAGGRRRPDLGHRDRGESDAFSSDPLSLGVESRNYPSMHQRLRLGIPVEVRRRHHRRGHRGEGRRRDRPVVIIRELVGLPANRALAAFGHGDFATAARLLRALPPVAHRIGGSHAQRDVLHLTRAAASARSLRHAA